MNILMPNDSSKWQLICIRWLPFNALNLSSYYTLVDTLGSLDRDSKGKSLDVLYAHAALKMQMLPLF